MSRPVIGLDLDNTIIDYSRVFGPAAQAMQLSPAGAGLATKAAVKAQLLESGGEEAWMRLQGQVYGRFISQAEPYPGCKDFIRAVKKKGATVSIVSHKTKHGHFDPERVDLWQAARGWLEEQGFTGEREPLIDSANIYFETTRVAKVARIAAIGCGVFIDDLREVLDHPDFPSGVEGLWFGADRAGYDSAKHAAPSSWPELMDKVLAML